MIFINGLRFRVGNEFVNGAKAFDPFDPLNPLDLPPFTIRLKYKDGVTPSFSKGTGVQVSQNPNIWDLTYVNSDWDSLLNAHTDLLEVLGANTTGITNMQGTFVKCASLLSVPLFDTSNVTNMYLMFSECESLQTVPLFNTVNVTYVDFMFAGCIMVQSGALALYQQLSSIKPSPQHHWAFHECGSYTASGSVELSQIPKDWK